MKFTWNWSCWAEKLILWFWCIFFISADLQISFWAALVRQLVSPQCWSTLKYLLPSNFQQLFDPKSILTTLLTLQPHHEVDTRAKELPWHLVSTFMSHWGWNVIDWWSSGFWSCFIIILKTSICPKHCPAGKKLLRPAPKHNICWSCSSPARPAYVVFWCWSKLVVSEHNQ